MDDTERPLDFIVTGVLDLTDYSDRRVIVTLVNEQLTHIRLHVTPAMAELLCERMAIALESRYGEEESHHKLRKSAN
jgi:hypothetical protein